MRSDLYTILALAARYWFCALALIIVFRAWRVTVVDNRRAKTLRALMPEHSSIGEFIAHVGKSKKKIRAMIPREGVLGSGASADVRIKHPALLRKHAFLESREGGLLVRPLRGASITVGDGITGGQFLLSDGDVMIIGELKLILVLFDASGQPLRSFVAESVPSADESPDLFFDEDNVWENDTKKGKKRR